MIAVDWGTSSLRLYRLDAAGMVRERRRSDDGVLALSKQIEFGIATAGRPSARRPCAEVY